MLSYIKGKVIEAGGNTLVVECGGLGYELLVSRGAAGAAAVGSEVKLPVYLSVSETGVALYGFKDAAEKDMFLKLIGISGIGAKMAIGILSGMGVNDLIAAIARGDVKGLSGIKGIGKKTAERIALELRDKIGAEIADMGEKVGVTPDIVPDEDAVLALMALGFNKNEAVSAVARVHGEGLTTEQIVFMALKA